MATWPTSLPDNFLASAYSESPPDNTIRTKMDVGPPKMRRRGTAAARPIRGTLLMTDAQLATFDTFYDSTLDSGADRFDWTHPRSGSSVEFRFVSPPSYSARGRRWVVTVDMEIMP